MHCYHEQSKTQLFSILKMNSSLTFSKSEADILHLSQQNNVLLNKKHCATVINATLGAVEISHAYLGFNTCSSTWAWAQV